MCCAQEQATKIAALSRLSSEQNAKTLLLGRLDKGAFPCRGDASRQHWSVIGERSPKQPQEHEDQGCEDGELHQGEANEIAGL
jgi:hypothetical protein